MMRCPALRWLSLAVLAFSTGAFARTEAPLTYRAIREIPPAAVGLQLLGPEHGADIVRIDFIDLGPNPRRLPSGVQLFLDARPVPLGPAYCTQRRYYRFLTRAASMDIRPLTRGEPLRILEGWDEIMFARAHGCRVAAGQLFAQTREPELAMRTLDGLASAQAVALSATGTMPFQLTCRDEVEDDPDRCGAGTREVLARLPLDHACYVDRASDDQPNIDVYLCTGGPLWVLHLLIAGSGPPRLSMVWKYPDGGY